MQAELYVTVMSGFVIALFLIVGEIAVLRKRIPNIYARFRLLYQSGHKARLGIEVVSISMFFLIQPIIVAVLVALALDHVDTVFSGSAMQQLRQILADIIK